MGIVTAQQYREARAKRHLVTVPGSDLTIEVKPVDVIALAVSGRIDIQAFDDLRATLKMETFLEQFQANAERFAGVIDALVCAGAVSPRIGREPQPGDSDVLWIDEIDLATKIAILRHITTARQTVDAAAATSATDRSVIE